MSTAASDAWAERAGAVPIEDELGRRGVHLRGKIERAGPCPVCGGTDRFSINTQKQVWNCRHCGKGGDVIDLVQHLDGSDFTAACTTLIGDRPQAQPNGMGTMGNGKDEQAAKPKKVDVGKWQYTDEAGKMLFGVKRVEYQNPDGSFVLKADGKRKKDFLQCRPDPERPGEVIWNVSGVRVVPYCLPELLKNPSAPVFVVEGELKVQALRKWGLVATCNACGAGKWTAEHAEFLRGRDVAIIPDNDEPGRKHAEMVARSLIGIAKEIHIIELPGLGPKEDIIDWIKRGNILETFSLLVEQSKPWAPRSEAESKPQPDPAGAANGAGAEQQEQPGNGDAIDLGERDAGDDVDPPPPREWLLGNQFCRTFLSGLFAPGSTGKSALRLAQYLSLVTGRSLTGEHVFKRCRVLVVSLEDDEKEMRRRILAARLHYNISLADVKGWLFYATPKGLKLAEMRSGSRQIGLLEKALRTSIERRKPDLLGLDPFVKLHALEENDNGAMDFVADLLVSLSVEYNIAVDIPHHTKKGQLTPGDADSGRGASAIRDAGRLMHTLTTMDETEAKAFGIDPEQRHAYVRLDKGKVNLVPPARTATWFKLVSVRLDNGNTDYPNGDDVQTVEPWNPPKIWEGLSSVTLNAALTDIDKGLDNGQRFSSDAGATGRAAWRVVQQHCPDRTEAQCREIIRAWVKSRLLYNETYDDPIDRRERKGLRVDATKRPS